MKINEIFKNNIIYLLSKTTGEVRGEFAEKLKQFELIPPHYGVIKYLMENGPSIQQDLVNGLNMHKASLGRIVDGLENSGIVIRCKSLDNKKEKIVELTKTGKSLGKKISKIQESIEKRYFDKLTTNEKEKLKELLLKLHE